MNDPVTHGEGRTRFTDFRMEMKTNMPVFKVHIPTCLFSRYDSQSLITCPFSSYTQIRVCMDDKRQYLYLVLKYLIHSAERSFCEKALLRVQMVER